VRTAADIDEYLARVDAKFRPLLRSVRRTIRAAAPRATESISYGIPTYKLDGQRLTYFSAATDHCTVHMVRKEHLNEAVCLGFGVGRGSIRFTRNKPIPARLLTRIVKARAFEIDARPRLARSDRALAQSVRRSRMSTSRST
jgi:uncharacterized protein YdhG (YjbR/CyaY superfamily)